MMGKFKVGQMVKCIWVNFGEGLTTLKDYEVLDIDYSDDTFSFIDDDGDERSILMENSCVAKFEPVTPKFEPVTPKFTAVSGDQSLFDLVGASDNELYIVKASTTHAIYADYLKAGNVIAERKPYVEKYVPKVGDEYRLKGYVSLMKCLFIDNDGEVYGSENGYVYSHNKDQFTFVKVGK